MGARMTGEVRSAARHSSRQRGGWHERAPVGPPAGYDQATRV
jgi:hypothetical protein